MSGKGTDKPPAINVNATARKIKPRIIKAKRRTDKSKNNKINCKNLENC